MMIPRRLALAALVAAAVCATGLVRGSSGSTDLAWVTCGSTVKLAHAATDYRLHSHQIAYSRGSQQQSVTAFPESDDAGSYWAVLGAADEPCAPGQPVKKKQRLRLQHVATRRWLHSHHFQSPLSGNQEVSAFGGDAQSDGGDVWTIDWDGKAKYWKQDAKVWFRHVDTGGYLHSMRQAQFGHPIAGQREVCAIKSKGHESEWFAAEGVYLPRADKKAAAAAAGGAAGATGSGGGKDEL